MALVQFEGIMETAVRYAPTIGLEVHAELKTRTKMFCSSRNDPHAAEPNVHICPVCMGHPGTLPTVNKEAIKSVLTVGCALAGELATYTEFDRKNYFYPDIPKGYQISQYEHPLVRGGSLAGVAIARVHLEEDTARSLHDQGEGSLVDFNRAGVPLMELVTEPVIHEASTAGKFARELQLLLRTLGVSDANMEKGEMRVEANISVSKESALGTKVEVKNLNSFKSVEAAIVYEIKRQIKELEKGNSIVQETRGWNENTNKTFSQREKESSHDYRYFPDPDIPNLDVSEIAEFNNTRLSEIMSELPHEIRIRYSDLGISSNQIEILISDTHLLKFFDEVLALLQSEATQKVIKIAANYVTSDILGYLASHKEKSIETASVSSFVALIKLLESKTITSRVAKDLLVEVVFEDRDPGELVAERDLAQSSSEEDLSEVVDKITREHASIVEEYKNGKGSAIQFLVGQGMKMTRGSADPEALKSLIKTRID